MKTCLFFCHIYSYYLRSKKAPQGTLYSARVQVCLDYPCKINIFVSEKRCNFATSMRKEMGSAEEQPISAIFDAGHASVAPVIGVFLCGYFVPGVVAKKAKKTFAR